MSKLTEKAVALLQEGEVNLVIGYEEGNHGTRPLFCRQAENADRYWTTVARIISQFI